MAKWYREKKKQFDDMVYSYLVKRLKAPINSSDAFYSGFVDEFGNVLKKDDGEWAYTKLDKLLFTIKAALGDKIIGALPTDYDGVNAYSIMNGVVDAKDYANKYKGLVSLVEECSYLPPDQRGKGDYIDKDEELSWDERIERALTCASFLMYAVKNDGTIPSEQEYNGHVLPSVEATFNVRSIGSCAEITDYLKKSGLIDYKNLTNDGYILAVRLAKWIVGHDLCSNGMKNDDDMGKYWRTLSNAG